MNEYGVIMEAIHYHARRRVALCCLIVALSSRIHAAFSQEQAQRWTAPPEVEVELNKATYQQYEPVLLEIRLINTSSVPQEYGPVGLPYPYSHLHYRIVGPQGNELRMRMPGGGGEIIVMFNSGPPYEPGESRSEVINLLVYAPIEEPGTYAVEVLFPKNQADPDAGYASDRVVFDVLSLNLDPGVMAALKHAEREIFNLFWVEPTHPETVSEALEKVIDRRDLPPQVVEFADFLYTSHELRKLSTGPKVDDPLEQRQRLMQRFVRRHPQSVYTRILEGGFGL